MQGSRDGTNRSVLGWYVRIRPERLTPQCAGYRRAHRKYTIISEGVTGVPKVLISGYYGFGNCGDEAMLFAIISQLKRRLPDLQVVVLSQQPEKTAGDFGVRAVARLDFRLIWRELGEADLLLSGGGSLFQDVTSPRNVFYYAAVVWLARLRGKKVYLCGQGIGPLRRRLSRCVMKRVARWADLITLRDEASLRELTSLGSKGPMRVTADPVLGLGTELINRERGAAILAATGLEKGPVIGVSLRQWSGLASTLKAVAALLDKMTKTGWQVVLVPLQREDREALGALERELASPAVYLENLRDFRDLMAVIANCDFCIGMRLHFLIFAVMGGVPAVGLSYDPKVTRFMNQVGLPVFPVGDLLPDDLSRVTEGLLAEGRLLREQLRERVAALKARADIDGELVAGLLRRG